MITQQLIDWLMWSVAWLIDLLPDFDLPDWYGTAVNFWANTIASAASLDAWVNLGAVYNAAILVFASIGIAIAIKVGRIALSFLTLGGGSAA